MSVEKLEGYITYGPLIYAKDFFEDDGIANYFWPGSPPVGYNNLGIPIDEEGMECLDLRCPLHPSWMPLKSEMEYNEYLGFSIPSYYPYIDWLKQNNLSCTPEQAKKLLFKWILNKSNNDRLRRKIKYSILQILRDELISLSELLKRVY
tara:strand:- start:676 stop:1122 length:447 start_codon:yes stop_codon:yes gene_type:complete